MVSPFQEISLNPRPDSLTNRFGIYVHVPFCIHKCSYCDFYSFTKYSSADFNSFVDSLILEVRSAAQWLSVHRPTQQPVTSIFLGGGTPSLLPTNYLGTLFEVLSNEFSWAPNIEITLEANPETVSEDLAREWKEKTPINRISMGAQSFQPEYLKALERLGSPEKIREAAAILKKSGFSNFNLDLIIGIPGQTSDQVKKDIEWAGELGSTHISNYNLTLKPGHPLFKKLPPDDESADLYETARIRLKELGYVQYEISNYALPGFECSHNLLYWTGGDFLGVGPSAASRFFWDGVFHHRKQLADYSQYARLEDFSETPWNAISREQTQLEALFLELRRNEGIHVGQFFKRYGLNLEQSSKLPFLEKMGFLEMQKPTLRLTDKGRLVADSLVCELI
ncbi:MAG: radical SAM family heme chaperone HemW [Pseudomonadota bacterium]